jgi:high affinity Mn2+ porin
MIPITFGKYKELWACVVSLLIISQCCFAQETKSTDKFSDNVQNIPGISVDESVDKPAQNIMDFSLSRDSFGEANKSQYDWLSLHTQLTYLSMWHDSIKNKSQNQIQPGANNLDPASELKSTFDATLLVGFRLAEHTAFFVNPEIDQGFGLSNTVGLAGFPSGSAYKVGQKEPYGRIPRAFLRQTFNLGGEKELIEEGPNQFANEVTHNNLTLTVGKFSVVDIFDTNRYSHDPRADFMNWSVLDSGAFDYAADSWGFTYGLAAEWRQENWTLRTGLFDLSSIPNSEKLDSSFKQYEWVNEIERRYFVGQREGSLKLLAYVNRGFMGSYIDAVSLAVNSRTSANCPTLASSSPASTSCVRQFASQGGIALNLEQELSRSTGFFARLSANQGKKETYDFTEINQSLAAGLVFQGSSWGRGGDTVGTAGVVNALTADARKYFSAGGVGILIGDGWQNYGQEMISETYYNARLSNHITSSLDFQYVVNPAYNRDRGPVSILGIRLHLEF